ncbi:unnamed protein product [Caenorhabditis auriculariae]|uniref:Tyrosine-protein kinase n=1 Tax=Caenorhabditis auriculariae TaxID=2777116 RepID=A0A8S1HQU8_9PELO|nr:unnamed protein product [Caenorhabditis auriculariae]
MVSVDVEGAKMDPGDPQEEVKNSSGLVFQRIKSGISWFFGGGDRAKSGTDDVFQTEWLVETDNKALSSAPKAIKLESLLMRLENKYAPVEDDEFIDQLWFNHGFLPQMETRMFLRRGGAFLVRKFNYSESEGGKDDLVISVAVPLEYTRTESDDKDENYGRDEPVFIQDYIVSKDGRSKETEIFIDDKMCFENFQDLLAYYIFNPNKESLNIKLFYPAPNRYFQYRQNALKRVETLATGELKEVYIADLEQFGSVEDAKVAVKQVKKDSPNTYDLNEKLIEEARMLLCLDHEHILICHGWQIHKMPFQFIFEYMEGGTLLQFLLTNFDTTSNKRLLQLSLEAARGLQYLHEKRVIHRNICAENCLLSKNGTLRIAGFSLAYRGHAYYMKAPEKLQTRYLAPENLTIFIFISQSDVYSFGVSWNPFFSTECGVFGAFSGLKIIAVQ